MIETLPTSARELQREIAEAIVQSADPEKVFLFGSNARGDARAGSDLDLLIVERSPFGPNRTRENELRKIRRALSRFPFSKDILVYSADEFEKWSKSPNHVVARCVREGRLIYARP
jgi:predicted nucleotidyltransferase